MSEPNNHPQNEDTATDSQEKATIEGVLGDSAKLAAGYAAAKAEAAKITSISLPSAYTALGQHGYESSDEKIAADRPEPAKLEEIDKKLADMAASVEQKTSAAETFSEKAKAMASAVASAGQRQLLLRNKNKLLATLGEYIFLHSESGPQDLREPITTLRERLTTLQAQVEKGKEDAQELRGKTKVLAASVGSSASKTGTKASSFFTRRRLAWIGGVFAVLLLYGIYSQRVENQAYSKAHQLWDADKRAEAVEKYTALLSGTILRSTENQEIALSRSVEFQCEQYEWDSATALIEKAHQAGITLDLTNPDAIAIQETVKEEARLAAKIKPLSADFLPYKKGALAEFDVTPSVGVERTERWTFEGSNIIKKTIVRQGTGSSTRMTKVDIPMGSVQHRKKSGFVELGTEQGRLGTHWRRLVKIDAKVGDTWESEKGNAFYCRYTFAGVEEPPFLDPPLPAAVIREATYVDADGNQLGSEIEYLLVEGIGIVGVRSSDNNAAGFTQKVIGGGADNTALFDSERKYFQR